MATPQTVRHLNKVRALNTLFRQRAMTRASLARSLGLNRSSIGFIVDELLADGLVREREIVSSRHSGGQKTGRPGIHVQIDPNGGIFLGAEIGVDHVTIAAIDLAAREIRCDSTPYAVSHYPPIDSVAKVGALLNAVIGSFANNAARIKGICVAVPALVRDGVVCNGLMLGWRDVELRRELASTLCADLPIVVVL